MDLNKSEKFLRNFKKSSQGFPQDSPKTKTLKHYSNASEEEEKHKERIKNEIIEFVNNNVESFNENSNLNVFNSLLISDDLSSNNENDEDIQNYNGERLTFLLNNQILFLDKNSSLIKSKDTDENKNCNNEQNECIGSEIKAFPIKKFEKIRLSLNEEPNDKYKNPSYLDSFQTSTTSIRKKINAKELTNDLNFDININKKDFDAFFNEINLNEKYANKLIENGFDDLELLIEQTKEVSALSDQNLKEIGILIPGDRAKILIHLEQRAGIIPYKLPNEIIYNNDLNIKKEYSIEHYLNKNNLKNYEKNFKDNGYNNSPLLFSQMLTRQPLTDDILKNDLGIENKADRNKILVGLFSELKNYCKKLRTSENVNMQFDGKNSGDLCETCTVF